MLYRKLDSSGDMVFGNGMNDFYTDAEAVAQAVKTNLLLFQGEWWESTETGLPLFQHILGQSGTPEHVQAADLLVQDVITSTPGVIRINDFKSAYESRKYTMTCTIQTQYGETEVIF